MIRYTKQEIDVIRDKNNQFTIPTNILSVIQDIVREVGNPTYVKTPAFYQKKKKHQQPLRALERTDSINSVSKEEKNVLQDIQGTLNKISMQNYQKLESKIVELVSKAKKTESVSFEDVTKKIYEVASNQALNVPLYASLYKALIEQYPEFQTLCMSEYDNYFHKFENIVCVTADIDYDEFCRVNVLNDKIRSISEFYTELVKKDILTIDHIVKLIRLLQTNLVHKGREDTPDENPCIEYTENIYILVKGTLTYLLEHESWEGILRDIEKIKDMKGDEYMNITNKIRFRHMDLLDLIRKKC